MSDGHEDARTIDRATYVSSPTDQAIAIGDLVVGVPQESCSMDSMGASLRHCPQILP